MAMDPLYTDALKELEQVKAERDEFRQHLLTICKMTGQGDDIGAAHEGVNAVIEQRDAHRKAEEMQIALTEKMEDERDALRNLIDQFKAATIKASMNGFGQDDVHHDDSWIDELDHALTRTQHHDAKPTGERDATLP